VIDGVDVNINYSILGSIGSRPNRQQPGTTVAKLKLVLKGVGTATYGGTIFPLIGNLTANFEIVGSTMSGPTRGRLCARGLGCASGRGFHSFDLPAGASNNWMLIADLQNPGGNRLQGAGSVRLTNGRSVPLNFLGQYNPRTDTFRLKTARGSAGKLAIQASAAGTTMLIQKLKGKIMGQALK
jgi:hypothetical protein